MRHVPYNTNNCEIIKYTTRKNLTLNLYKKITPHLVLIKNEYNGYNNFL